MKKTIILFTIISVFIACKKDSAKIDQNDIFQYYSMYYNAETNETTCLAHFYKKKENGRTLKLGSSSSVTVNGILMEQSSLAYKATFNGQLDTAIFVFVDENGTSYTNMATSVSSIANAYEYYIYKSNAVNDWYFDGIPIQENEEVVVTLINNTDVSSSSTSKNDNEGANFVPIKSTDTENLNLGLATARTKRTRIIETGNFAAAGGIIYSSYHSLSHNVSVE